MADTVRERHYRDRMQSMRQLAATEQVARSWQDYEDLVALCFDLALSGRDLMEKEYRRIFKDANLTVAWLQERQRVIEELGAGYVELAEAVRTSAHEAWLAAGSPNGGDCVSRLDSAIKDFVEAKRAVLDRWLVGTPPEIAEAKAAISRGETVEAETAFAEIAGTDVETWRRTIEEYRTRRLRSTGG